MDQETHLIGIGGPSCAGKSELARHLALRLGGTVLGLDAYYRDLSALDQDERVKVNFDHPDALDRELLSRQLRELGRGECIDVPMYDFRTHTRLQGTQRVKPGCFLLVEGLLALYWEDVRELFATAVFVDAPDTVCLSRRQVRDVLQRGRSFDSVLAQFTETVQPMAARYVRPTRACADIVVLGEDPIENSVATVLALMVDKRILASAYA